MTIKEDLNSSYTKFFKSIAPELICYGGTNAGKSYSAAQKLILEHLYNYKEYGYSQKSACYRKTGPALRLTSWDTIQDLLDLYNIPYKPQLQKFEINLLNCGKIIFSPITNTKGEPAERLKSLKNLDLVWIEEPTELTEDEYDRVLLGLAGPPNPMGYRQTILTFNPIDQNHWLKKRFFDGNIGDRQKYTYKDNLKFLDQFTIDRIEALKDQNPYMYQVYGLGEWGVYEDVIYSNYMVENIEHSIDYYDELLGGLDFGWENPQAHLLIGIKEYDLYILNEIYKTRMLNSDFGEIIKSLYAELKIPHTQTICDTNPQLIRELELKGLIVYPAIKGADSVVNGIKEVLKYKIHIDESCINTIKEIQGYRRKKDRHGNTLEEPVDFNNHSMDALRYPMYWRAQRVEPRISTFGKRPEKRKLYIKST